jgi:peroxiredoxin/outer membrane lipoprotein-sorting protein
MNPYMKLIKTVTFSLLCLTALATLALCPVWAQETPGAVPAAPIAESLTKAKTVSMKALFSVYQSKEQKFMPFFDVAVTVEKPNHYRIDATPSLKTDGPPKPTSFYFSDGVKQYEYNSLIGRYRIEDAPKPSERPMSQLAAMAGLRRILSPGALPSHTGVQRTVSEDTVEGRKLILSTDTEAPRTTQDGKSLVAYTKVWYDPASNLPVRALEGFTLDTVDMPNLLLEYRDWTFDAPVPPSTFVWAVPPGAEEEVAGLPVGTMTPDFEATAADGKKVRLSSLKGKIVVLDFWATWCAPCQKSMPRLETIYRLVKNKDVVVLGVCVWDEKPEYLKWLAAKRSMFTFPTVFVPGDQQNNPVTKLFKVSFIPTQYVIDKTGKVAAVFSGYYEDKDLLETALRKLKVDVPAHVAASSTGLRAK